jgi:serine/threonine-protein kinase
MIMSASSILRLGREWELGNQIGEGGFGQVFEAKSGKMPPAVAKLVPKEPGADRELLFENPSGVPNVVPIIDKGETSDSWVLIMPRADKSLAQHLEDTVGPLQAADAVPILVDIAKALAGLDGKIVHRDLKPGNVLLLNGHWCFADFGISRYAEASTALDTKKFALSPPYAAPERWRAERATSATDVYSLGVIAFQLLTGRLPFPGPDVTDYRDQHLHGKTPSDDSISAPLASLIGECLFKAPGARPGPANVLARLERLGSGPQSPAVARLRAANAAVIRGRAESEQQASSKRTEKERRKDLYDCAVPALEQIWEQLTAVIKEAAPAAATRPGRHGLATELNGAWLELSPVAVTAQSPWGNWDAPAFDVIAHASMSLTIPRDRYGYEGRSHSLWYCDAQEADRYQWFETAFMFSPFLARTGRQDPFTLDPGTESAKALWTGMAEWQAAWPFTPLNANTIDEFIERWVDWFALAAQGQLQHPSTMPERPPQNSWRRK